MSKYYKRILFLGNSYIYVNDLPSILTNLALSGGYNLYIDHITRGGAILQNFLNAEDELSNILTCKLNENNWDFIVLQEQSQIPAIPDECKINMYPSIRLLNNKIKSCGAETLLFMSWGRHYGDIKNGFEDFETMQEAIKDGYTQIGSEISALVVPVGIAWLKAKQKLKDIMLWDEDGSHPTMLGTYLAACVFYALLLKQNPIGLTYNAGISSEMTRFLQEIASEALKTY